MPVILWLHARCERKRAVILNRAVPSPNFQDLELHAHTAAALQLLTLQGVKKAAMEDIRILDRAVPIAPIADH